MLAQSRIWVSSTKPSNQKWTSLTSWQPKGNRYSVGIVFCILILVFLFQNTLMLLESACSVDTFYFIFLHYCWVLYIVLCRAKELWACLVSKESVLGCRVLLLMEFVRSSICKCQCFNALMACCCPRAALEDRSWDVSQSWGTLHWTLLLLWFMQMDWACPCAQGTKTMAGHSYNFLSDAAHWSCTEMSIGGGVETPVCCGYVLCLDSLCLALNCVWNLFCSTALVWLILE